jgi:hypothetical protein
MVLGATTAYERGRRCVGAGKVWTRALEENAGAAGGAPTTLDESSHRALSARALGLSCFVPWRCGRRTGPGLGDCFVRRASLWDAAHGLLSSETKRRIPRTRYQKTDPGAPGSLRTQRLGTGLAYAAPPALCETPNDDRAMGDNLQATATLGSCAMDVFEREETVTPRPTLALDKNARMGHPESGWRCANRSAGQECGSLRGGFSVSMRLRLLVHRRAGRGWKVPASSWSFLRRREGTWGRQGRRYLRE